LALLKKIKLIQYFIEW